MHVNYLLLFWGFVCTFMLPGFVLIQGFYSYLPVYKKMPLIGVTSIIISTYASYFSFLIFGYSRLVLTVVFLLISLSFLVTIYVRGFKFKKIKLPKRMLVLSGFIYFLFLGALAPGIMTYFNGYWVLSAVNWQDTAMHLGIMESIAEGNFPPQAPYFSGQPLTYYYFSDFHTSLISLYSDFPSWKVLVWDNPFFAAFFSLAIYALSFFLTRDKLASFFASLMSVFAGNLMFIYFVSDWAKSNFSVTALRRILENQGYTMDFETVMTMVPMADYFLQNRPMMIGLTAVTCVLLLVLEKKHWRRSMFLAATLSAFIFKFQLFASFVGFMVIGLAFIFQLKRRTKKEIIQTAGLVTIPALVVFFWLILSSVGSKGFVELLLETIRLGPWNKEKGGWWYLLFYPANLGMSFILGLLVGLKNLRHHKSVNLSFLFIFSLYCNLIPLIVVLTVYEWDMFKFFYFSQIGFVVLSGIAISWLWKKKLGKIIAAILIAITCFTSVLTLLWSGFNKYQAYTADQYQVGIWIKNNTQKNSVFLTPPSVHSPVTQIAGRLRVLSYTTWPYSHGYNMGPDNVFSRLEDVEKFYDDPKTIESKLILEKYNIDYIYWDKNTESDYPGSYEKLFNAGYKLEYQQGEVALFKPQDVF